MDDLITWLLAQIDADQKNAEDCIAEIGSWRKGDQIAADRYLPGQPPETPEYEDRDAFPSYPWGVDDRELAFMAGPGHPDRVLAECEAKRRRIEHLTDAIDTWRNCGLHDSATREQAIDDLETALRLEVFAYAGRPGYQESWRP